MPRLGAIETRRWLADRIHIGVALPRPSRTSPSFGQNPSGGDFWGSFFDVSRDVVAMRPESVGVFRWPGRVVEKSPGIRR